MGRKTWIRCLIWNNKTCNFALKTTWTRTFKLKSVSILIWTSYMFCYAHIDFISLPNLPVLQLLFQWIIYSEFVPVSLPPWRFRLQGNFKLRLFCVFRRYMNAISMMRHQKDDSTNTFRVTAEPQNSCRSQACVMWQKTHDLRSAVRAIHIYMRVRGPSPTKFGCRVFHSADHHEKFTERSWTSAMDVCYRLCHHVSQQINLMASHISITDRAVVP
jgi:hypothetical protein